MSGEKDMESTDKIMDSNREALGLMGGIVDEWVKAAEDRGATLEKGQPMTDEDRKIRNVKFFKKRFVK